MGRNSGGNRLTSTRNAKSTNEPKTIVDVYDNAKRVAGKDTIVLVRDGGDYTAFRDDADKVAKLGFFKRTVDDENGKIVDAVSIRQNDLDKYLSNLTKDNRIAIVDNTAKPSISEARAKAVKEIEDRIKMLRQVGFDEAIEEANMLEKRLKKLK